VAPGPRGRHDVGRRRPHARRRRRRSDPASGAWTGPDGLHRLGGRGGPARVGRTRWRGLVGTSRTGAGPVAKVRPFLRSDDQDEEGVEFLPSVLPNSGVIQVARHAGGTSPLVGRVRPQDVPPRTSPGGCRPDATCCRARRRPPAHRGRGVSSGGRSRWCRSWRHRSRRSDRQLRPRRPVEDRIRPRGRPASGRGTTDRRRVDRAEDRPSPPGRRGPTVTACRARTSAVHEGRRDPSTSLRRQWGTS